MKQNNSFAKIISERNLPKYAFLIADSSILLYNTAKLGFVGWNLKKGFQKPEDSFCLFWDDSF